MAEHRLDPTFTAQAAGDVWHTDITSLPTGEGWLSLAGVKAPVTGERVGYARRARLNQDLRLMALSPAIRSQHPAPGLIQHSERGSQDGAWDYQARRRPQGFRVALSRKGNCSDNAPLERFWGSLKSELTHHHRYDTRAEAEAAIREDIELFYNRQRRHPRLGHLAPAVVAQHCRRR